MNFLPAREADLRRSINLGLLSEILYWSRRSCTQSAHNSFTTPLNLD